MNHHHIDRRIARSAECSSVGRSPTEPEVIAALVRRARAAGVVVFLPEDLDQMNVIVRTMIDGEHERIYQRGVR